MRKPLAACIVFVSVIAADTGYKQTIEHWRQEREAKLKADDGWLTLAGLIWLQEGPNTVGSASSSKVKLARGPARIGVIDYKAGKASFRADPGTPVTINGKAAANAPLRSDADDQKPDLVQTEDYTFFVIHRGTRDAIRLKDKQSEYRRNFTGLHWYPVHEDYRVEAKWEAYPESKLINVPNILGETEKSPSPGYAVLTLHGQQFRLDPVAEDGQLFFIFRDQTAGHETYPSGRFLYAQMPQTGKVVLDFNKAYNPPCAFTPYATCPLPPQQNRMATRVEAGELNYGHH